ncbi:hypothetical protein BU16DRAFT_558721 [Lophium mytilinum]|uniref:Dynamin family protein n=1 Tax=Lophium mytilinum TaxID=390894 RepID=A0A6A6R5C5_9PEZI|nr:hypothetical protein BU16DRAFT_558721 [Lophium mytilinum]
MSPTEFETPVLDQIYSPDQVELFDTIDRLRHHEACREAGLPQLIVTGDQSSGKSSILAGLTGLPFPTKDGLCTTFATELVIRRGSFTRLSSSIKPGPNRSPAETQRLLKFQSTFSSPDKISELIEDAKAFMRGGSHTTANAFSEDILQIEIVGPKRVPLTIVDLPGLIQSVNDGQKARDVEFVHSLVKSYMEKPRSIILAVVSAKSERAAQRILRYTKEIDPRGTRTLGIITKPDTLDPGSENETSYIQLARNESIHLKLGWHVVKNRSYQTRQCSDEERDAAETEFFSTGKWASISPGHRGIESLRTRLGDILQKHICDELPFLSADLKIALDKSRRRREKLGKPRISKDDYQLFLVKISEHFQTISRDAVNASYNSPFFNLSSSHAEATRLRGRVQNLNMDFAQLMYANGHTTHIVRDGDLSARLWSTRPDLELEVGETGVMTRSSFLKVISRLDKDSRGTELPYLSNPHLIGDLFKEQSKHWATIGEYHLERVHKAVMEFLGHLLENITDPRTANGLMIELIDSQMEEMGKDLDAKLQELVSPYTSCHPITYDANFINEVQQARAQRQDHGTLGKKAQISGNAELVEDSKKSSEDFAYSEILDAMQAYYNVAIQVFISNITVLAVEKCLIAKIPAIFDSSTVLGLTEDQLEAIAGESAEVRRERSGLDDKIEDLESGYELLKTFARHGASHNSRPSILVTPGNHEVRSENKHLKAELENRTSRSQSRSSHRSRASTPSPSISSFDGSSPSSSPPNSGTRSTSSLSSYDVFDTEERKDVRNLSPAASTPSRKKKGERRVRSPRSGQSLSQTLGDLLSPREEISGLNGPVQ